MQRRETRFQNVAVFCRCRRRCRRQRHRRCWPLIGGPILAFGRRQLESGLDTFV